MAVKFQQWVNSFDSTTVETGCSVSLDAGGVITSTIQSASDTADTAVENITSNLPTGEEGRARFYFTVPSVWAATGNMTFFHVENAGVQILEMFLTATGRTLAMFSSAGRLSTAGFNIVISQAMDPGSEHLLEVAWKKNAFVKVWVDGVQVCNLAQSGAASTAVPTLATLGIHHYDGADGSGATMKFRLFQLSDSATDNLSEPVGIIPLELTKTLDRMVGAGMWQLFSQDSASTSAAVDGQRLDELSRVAKVNNYELRFASGLLIISPRR